MCQKMRSQTLKSIGLAKGAGLPATPRSAMRVVVVPMLYLVSCFQDLGRPPISIELQCLGAEDVAFLGAMHFAVAAQAMCQNTFVCVQFKFNRQSLGTRFHRTSRALDDYSACGAVQTPDSERYTRKMQRRGRGSSLQMPGRDRENEDTRRDVSPSLDE